MEYFDNFCKYLSELTTIDKTYISLVLSTTIVIILFSCLKKLNNIITIVVDKTSEI